MRKFLIFISLFLVLNIANATEIQLLQSDDLIIQSNTQPNKISQFFSKIWQCKWHLSCYSQNVGTTLTTILGTDTVKDALKTTVNNNFSALNIGKMETSTTSIDAITTLSNLVSVGALSSGSLTTGFTAIPVSLGGTGTTSPLQYFVILGDGANGLTAASSTGTSGQSFVSNGVGAYPTWQTIGVNQNDNYSWTGTHSFAASTVSIMGGLNLGNGTATTTLNFDPIGGTASSTALMTDGSGNLTWNIPVIQSIVASSIDSGTVAGNSTEEYVATTTIPAYAITEISPAHILITFLTTTDGSIAGTLQLKAKFGGTTVFNYTTPDISGTCNTAVANSLDLWISNDTGTSDNETTAILNLRCAETTHRDSIVQYTTSAINTTQSQFLEFTSQWSVADAQNTVQQVNAILEY